MIIITAKAEEVPGLGLARYTFYPEYWPSQDFLQPFMLLRRGSQCFLQLFHVVKTGQMAKY